MRQINLIVVHCTASRNGKARPVAAIEADHRARGFSSIGYHYVIQPDGHVDVGRDEEQPGAHAKGFNAHSLGVCLVGGLGGPNRLNPGLYTMAQWDALRVTVRSLLDRYPGARVVGHRDLSPDLDGDGEVEPHEWLKKCPAFEVRDWLAAGMVAPSDHVLLVGAAHA
jgi:N-acetylmuramoyl-L-alanine amidase